MRPGRECIPFFNHNRNPIFISRRRIAPVRRVLIAVCLGAVMAACARPGPRTGGGETRVVPGTLESTPGSVFTRGASVAPSQAGAGPIKILFAGDTHFQWGVSDLQKSAGLLAPVQELAPFFHAADFRILNLETSISDQGAPFLRKSYIFNAPPESVRLLEYLQVDLAVLGNNHSMDMGGKGMERTLRALRRVGIGAVGVGPNSSEAPGPFRFNVGGVRFAVLSYTGVGETETFSTRSGPGVASMHDRAIFQHVRAARRDVDQLIVSLHWGNEYYPRTDRAQIALARNLIDAGATAVVGHHPHVPQGVEVYRGGVICYSLGNFLFGSINEDQTHNMVIQLEVEPKKKQIAQLRVMPIVGRYRDAADHRLRPLPAADSREFWEEFYTLSRDLSAATVKSMRVHPDGTATISVNQ